VSTFFDTQKVLELACAAQRINQAYLKQAEYKYNDEGKFLFVKHDNKTLIRYALGIDRNNKFEQEFPPAQLSIEEDDKELTEEIRKYYKRLVFSAVKGDNEFQTEINSILNSDTITSSKIGYIACLPSVYKRDFSRNQISKRIRDLDKHYLDKIDSKILNKDCEILESSQSTNFPGSFNITAIIDNKLVSWFSKNQLEIGNCIIVKAKIKDHSTHWIHKDQPITRLNYVKAIQ
jgi:hypothetical protein